MDLILKELSGPGLAGSSSVTGPREEEPRDQKTKKIGKLGSKGLTHAESYAKQV